MKVLLNINVVLILSTNLSETLFILRTVERDMIKKCIGIHVKYPLFFSDINVNFDVQVTVHRDKFL